MAANENCAEQEEEKTEAGIRAKKSEGLVAEVCRTGRPVHTVHSQRVSSPFFGLQQRFLTFVPPHRPPHLMRRRIAPMEPAMKHEEPERGRPPYWDQRQGPPPQQQGYVGCFFRVPLLASVGGKARMRFNELVGGGFRNTMLFP